MTTLTARLFDKVAQHNFSYIKIGNNAILQWALGSNRAWCTTNHTFCIGANRKHAIFAFIDSNNRRLIKHDALATHGNKRVGCTQIDG